MLYRALWALTLLALVTSLSWAGDDVKDRSRAQADRAVPQENPLFMPAHRQLLEKAKSGQIDVYFLGDSITRRWHANDYPAFQENWKKNFHGWNAANFGWGADTTQNVLWRLENGELDGVNPKVIVIMIGTNNVGELSLEGDREGNVDNIARGIRTVLQAARKRAPRACVVLMGITPRNDKKGTALMPMIDAVNERIAKLANGKGVRYLNINDKLASKGGKLFEGVTEDGLHLSVNGYQIWADALKPIFTEWLGPPAKVDRAPAATGIPEVTRAQ